jgi:hypothetical protein
MPDALFLVTAQWLEGLHPWGDLGKGMFARTPRAPSGAAAPAPRFPLKGWRPWLDTALSLREEDR